MEDAIRGPRNRLEVSVTLGCRIERPLPFEPRSSPSWNRKQEREREKERTESLVFGSGCLVPLPLGELPLISYVLLSSTPFDSSLPSAPFFRRYVSHSIFSLPGLFLSGSYTCLDISLSSSTWFKWRLSALLEAVEEARPFRSVSSRAPIPLRCLPFDSCSCNPLSLSLLARSRLLHNLLP